MCFLSECHLCHIIWWWNYLVGAHRRMRSCYWTMGARWHMQSITLLHWSVLRWISYLVVTHRTNCWFWCHAMFEKISVWGHVCMDLRQGCSLNIYGIYVTDLLWTVGKRSIGCNLSFSQWFRLCAVTISWKTTVGCSDIPQCCCQCVVGNQPIRCIYV